MKKGPACLVLCPTMSMRSMDICTKIKKKKRKNVTIVAKPTQLTNVSYVASKKVSQVKLDKIPTYR